MISVKCPHCQVGLKVDEGKLPLGLTSFKCPNCKQSIPVSLVTDKQAALQNEEPETALLRPAVAKAGQLTVEAAEGTPPQTFPLTEGVFVVGRKSATSPATCQIETSDRSMSRAHIRIEVKKDGKGGFRHLLSDHNSKNRTLYNNHYLEDGEVVVLNDGDEIVIGKTPLRFSF